MAVQIYQIHLSLQESAPEIWRRLLVHPETTLVDLHRIIQTVMGWTNSHLHQFVHGQVYYAPKEFEIDYAKNSRKVKLNAVMKKENDHILYEYDFGDSWLHDIILEKILPFDKTVQIPGCMDGRGNCPPEDCGGIWGYQDLVAILSNPKHKDYLRKSEWLGSELDPDYFDKEVINKQLTEPDYGCIWLE